MQVATNIPEDIDVKDIDDAMIIREPDPDVFCSPTVDSV